MTTKPNSFDCVEMKRRAQEEILAQWEAQKGAFPSYGAFLEATLLESDWGRRAWDKLHGEKPALGLPTPPPSPQ